MFPFEVDFYSGFKFLQICFCFGKVYVILTATLRDRHLACEW